MEDIVYTAVRVLLFRPVDVASEYDWKSLFLQKVACSSSLNGVVVTGEVAVTSGELEGRFVLRK